MVEDQESSVLKHNVIQVFYICNIPSLHSTANALQELKIKSRLHRQQRNHCRAFEAGGRMGVKGRVWILCVLGGREASGLRAKGRKCIFIQSSPGVGLRLGLPERERLVLLWLTEREREREREAERRLGREPERERDLDRLLTGVLDLLERAGEPDLLLRLE